MRIGTTLKMARMGKELTQKQAAELLGVAKTSLISWETGKGRPSWRQIYKLKKLYGDELIKEYVIDIFNSEMKIKETF